MTINFCNCGWNLEGWREVPPEENQMWEVLQHGNLMWKVHQEEDLMSWMNTLLFLTRLPHQPELTVAKLILINVTDVRASLSTISTVLLPANGFVFQFLYNLFSSLLPPPQKKLLINVFAWSSYESLCL